jgi:hypothetical protein
VASTAATDLVLDEIKARPPDITIVACGPSFELLGSVVAAIRAREDPTCHFVFALLGEDTPSARTAAFDAGADEIVRAGMDQRELAGLLRSAERIVRLEQRLHARVMDLESALRRLELGAVRRGKELAAVLPGGVSAGSFLSSRAWNRVEEVFSVMCSDYLQGAFSPVVAADLPTADCLATTITLTDVEHELNIDLFFCVAKQAARDIAIAFCGDAELVNDELIQDVLLELANSGMGTLKGAFLTEKFTFAGSIPKAVGSEVPLKGLDEADAKRVLAFHSDKGTIHVVICLKHVGRVAVLATALREGMVLAADVTNDAGVLIVRAGTRLTQTTADRIARMVPKKRIELTDLH